MESMAQPRITKLSEGTPVSPARYILQGGEITEEWTTHLEKRGMTADDARCEFTTYDGMSVSSYGGTVWPSAYPDLFIVVDRQIHGQETRFTTEGQKLLESCGKAFG